MDGLTKRAPAPKVYLIGLGIPPVKALSLEALEAVRACKVLFVHSHAREFLAQFCSDVRVMREFGVEWSLKEMNAFLDAFLAVAKGSAPVGLAVGGHPLVYEPLGQHLRERCRRRGLPLSVASGLSSIDVLLTELGVSLSGEAGLQVGNPAHFLKSEPSRGSYIFVLQAMIAPQIFQKVTAHCRRFYPCSHQIALVECGAASGERELWFRLGEAGRRTWTPRPYATLVIPPCP